MNVRKPVDYTAMFAALDTLMAAALLQMELYCEIGRLVSGRTEKGAAAAAAEYLHGAYPDVSGFSPRNLRRMWEFYRTYESVPEVLAQAKPSAGHRMRMAQKKLPGHYCKVCGTRKSNESFSGKGHAVHICKACSRLSPAQQAEQMTLRRLENLPLRRLTENEMTWLKNRTHDHRPEVKALACMVYAERFPL